MKDKILIFIIGFLLGAIITTGGFIIYNKSNINNNNISQNTFERGNPPSMNGEAPGGNPPEKPPFDNGEEPPAKPDETNTNDDANNN